MLLFRNPAVRLRSGFVPLLILLAYPVFAEGQTVPGMRTPSREAVKAEFLSNILDGVDNVRREWMVEIRRDSLDPLMAHYTSDAVLIPPDGLPLKGRDAIRAFWEETLPRIESVDAGMTDMDASGQMAMIAGSYSMEWLRQGASPLRESGGLLTVYVQTGRRWFIRAQVFGGDIPNLPG